MDNQQPKSFVVENAQIATCTDPDSLGEIQDGALTVQDGTITFVGPRQNLPQEHQNLPKIDAENQWLLPGLIDCHTHLVYAGNRAQEFEQRLEGATYEEICNQGGGILSTVQATRSPSRKDPEVVEPCFLSNSIALSAIAQSRLNDFLSQGVTTIDIKSGYGLTTESEHTMLDAAKTLEWTNPIRVVKGFLGAHTVPPEFKNNPDAYIDLIINETLPHLHEHNLVDYVDAFCETVGFTPDQTRRVFQKAKDLGLPVRLHADQLSDLGGAGLAADFQALSADHVEYTSDESVKKMALNQTVAVLLPGAFYTLRETQVPPIDLFRQYSVPMAVSTDSNPGTSPTTSLLLMLNMACTLFRLTPTEALLGVTKNAAQALGLQKKTGSLAPGLSADLTLWNITHPRDLCYNFGPNHLVKSWFKGELVTSTDSNRSTLLTRIIDLTDPEDWLPYELKSLSAAFPTWDLSWYSKEHLFRHRDYLMYLNHEPALYFFPRIFECILEFWNENPNGGGGELYDYAARYKPNLNDQSDPRVRRVSSQLEILQSLLGDPD